jgi:hypothetical protein
MQVLEHYIPDTIKVPIVGNKPVGKAIRVERIVSPTTDEVANYWMMRQDPKTFIQSLLDWSCSFTENHTSWMVSNGETDDAISINVEEICTHDLHDPQGVGSSTGPLTFQYGPVQSGPSITNILKWDMLHDSFIVTLNSNLVTSGISAMSGEYFDRRVDPQRRTVYVNDDNTQNKVNPTFGKDRGYDKPRGDLQRGWTNITSIPEFHAGEIGYPYSKYIDGRARQTFMDMLNMVMRIKVTVVGEPRLFDSTDLGKSKIGLKWLSAEHGVGKNGPRFMDGNWLLYGWHHRLRTSSTWETDVYLARLDYNAKALPGNGS